MKNTIIDQTSGYSYLNDNAFIRKVSAGVNKLTGIENWRLLAETKPEVVESLYITNTDGLIGALDGSIVPTPDNNENDIFHYSEFSGEPADVAIYLDKSARPIRFLVDQMWDMLVTEGVKKPESKFLNIDKEIWLQRMGFNRAILQDISPDLVDVNRINPDNLREHVARIRAIFVDPRYRDMLKEDDPTSSLQLPTILDNKNVMIIDEVRSSGNTLRIALQLLKMALPESRLSTAYWSTPPLIRWSYAGDNGEIIDNFCAGYVPVWYDSDSPAGRGIDDIDPEYASNSSSYVQRLGKFILGTPYHHPGTNKTYRDKKSELIRKDLSLLASRAKKRSFLIRPSRQRDKEDYRNRAVTYNNLSSYKDFVDKVQGIR